MSNPDEVWVSIKKYDLYEVSSHGRIRNVKTGKIRKLIGSEYYQVALRIEGKAKHRSVHKLVAKAFIPRIKGKQVVNHKNGNKKDNRVENLEWVSTSENRLHAIHVLGKNRQGRAVIQCDMDGNELNRFSSIEEAKTALSIKSKNISSACKNDKSVAGFKWKFVEEFKVDDLSDWKEISYNTRYLVSPQGQIYSKWSKELMHPQLGADGYQRIILSDNGNTQMKYVHILVSECFIPQEEGKTIVNHKDGNKSNNTIENLEWTTQKDNISCAVKSGKIAKRVIQCWPESHRAIREYSSLKEAAEDHNIKHNSISRVLGGTQKTAAGFFWKLA